MRKIFTLIFVLSFVMNVTAQTNKRVIDGKPDDVATAANIAEFTALSGDVDLTLKNAEVLYTFTTSVGATECYVRDNSGAVLFRNTGLTLEKDDVVNGVVTLRSTSFFGLPMANNSTWTDPNDVTTKKGDAVKAKEIAISDVANYVNDLISVSNIEITSDGAKFYAEDSKGDKLEVSNYFGLPQYKDLPTRVGAKGMVRGIVNRYIDSYKLYLVEGSSATDVSMPRISVEEDGNIYNLNGQRVDSNYRGVVISGGKKKINK